MGMKRAFQGLLFNIEYYELTDWVCKEKETAEPETML